MSDFEYYRYYPSSAAAAIFFVVFGAASIIHSYQLCRSRTWYFIPFMFSGYFELISYIGRYISSTESPDWSLGPYLIHTLLALVAPALFAASIYMELGRIIKLTKGEDKAIIPTRWLTKIFVFGDVVSFLVQGGGGGVMAGNSLDSMKTGEKLVQLGLAIQIVFFALFIATAIVFHIRMRRDPYQQLSSKCHTCWQKHLSLLYATSIVILIRCLFRLIEYVQGNSGYLISHEAYLYVFDATLMFLTMVLFAVVHPSELNALLKGGKAKAIQKIVFLRSVDCGNSEELNELQRF